jgi:hypothetical protein
MFRIIILGLWAAGAAMELACLVVFAKRKLCRAYPVLTVFLIADALCFAVPFMTLLLRGPASYAAQWQAVQPAGILLFAALLIEALILQGKYFPGIAPVASIFIGIFTAISIAVCAVTAGIAAASWLPGIAVFLVIGRHFALACLVILEGSRLFFRLFPIRVICRNVEWHVLCLEILFGAQTAYFALVSIAGPSQNAFTAAVQLLGMAAPLAAYWLWLTKLIANGQGYITLPRTDPSILEVLRERGRRRIQLEQSLLKLIVGRRLLGNQGPASASRLSIAAAPEQR